MTLLASNTFYPVSFTEVVLPIAKITVTDISQATPNSATITLESTAVALFVKLSSEIVGYFSDNGFLMMPLEKVTVTFTSPDNFDVKMLQETLTIRSVKDTYKNQVNK